MAHHGDDANSVAPEIFNSLPRKTLDQLRDLQSQPLGPTGRFPQGHLSPDDEGELALGIAADVAKGKVILNFGKPVAWIGFDKEQAIALAALITENAEKLEG